MADVPRVQCSEHGVVTVSVPWAEPGSGFTVLFEALVINWLKAASTSAVSDRLRGFRNKRRFRNAIYFHPGGLQLFPAGFEA